jgi:hypothetical protein
MSIVFNEEPSFENGIALYFSLSDTTKASNEGFREINVKLENSENSKQLLERLKLLGYSNLQLLRNGTEITVNMEGTKQISEKETNNLKKIASEVLGVSQSDVSILYVVK